MMLSTETVLPPISILTGVDVVSGIDVGRDSGGVVINRGVPIAVGQAGAWGPHAERNKKAITIPTGVLYFTVFIYVKYSTIVS